AMTRITFINVGYGESILVEELKAGRRIFSMLVDGGNPYDEVYGPEYDRHPGQVPAAKYLHAQEIFKLDLVILTHFHIDHVGGLPQVLREFRCGELWSNYVFQEKPPAIEVSELAGYQSEARVMAHSLRLLSELFSLAGQQGIQVRLVAEDEFDIPLTSDLKIDRYAPGDAIYGRMDSLVKAACSAERGDADKTDAAEGEGNAESRLMALDRLANPSCTAFRIACMDRRVLLPADLPATFWNPILDEGNSIAADILKFAHHGQKDGVSKRFAAAVNPSEVVFCTSEDNPFHCPNPSVFPFFPAGTHFTATGATPLPPTWKTGEPHSAVIYEIRDDSSIRMTMH
ncbi:MAG: MBL fold metallo-hydrolase, partial [Spirochaetaceae bacterium]|nr:MBL fold metallo-hydrolase [Spirochaetaceae bacterium]